MRTILMMLVALLVMPDLATSGAEPQPNINQVIAHVTQLGQGWTSNRIVVLIDPLCSPAELADPKESPGWLKMTRDSLTKHPSREAQAMVRYHGSFGNDWCTNVNFLVRITRWKTEADIGDDWGRDKETKMSAGPLAGIGEEVRSYQRHGLHNNIAFRRGTYLIDVEAATTLCGWDNVKVLATVLDGNLLKAKKP